MIVEAPPKGAGATAPHAAGTPGHSMQGWLEQTPSWSCYFSDAANHISFQVLFFLKIKIQDKSTLLDASSYNSPWAWEFHPWKLRFCLSQTLWNQNLSMETDRTFTQCMFSQKSRLLANEIEGWRSRFMFYRRRASLVPRGGIAKRGSPEFKYSWADSNSYTEARVVYMCNTTSTMWYEIL